MVFGSYAVKAGSGEATSMNLESGVVAASVPVPFVIATGPSAVTYSFVVNCIKRHRGYVRGNVRQIEFDPGAIVVAEGWWPLPWRR